MSEEDTGWLKDQGDLRELVEGLERRIRALENINGANGITVDRGPDGVLIAGPNPEGQVVPDELPPGDTEYQVLSWDETNKCWVAGPLRLM